VERLGHHTYALAPRPGIVDKRQIARCVRHDRKPLDLAAARVLHRALTRPGKERTRAALGSPAERAAAARLVAGGLLEEKAGVYWPTQRAEATFAANPTPAAPSGPIEQSALERDGHSHRLSNHSQEAPQTALTEARTHSRCRATVERQCRRAARMTAPAGGTL
jgi:hypothetical protein